MCMRFAIICRLCAGAGGTVEVFSFTAQNGEGKCCIFSVLKDMDNQFQLPTVTRLISQAAFDGAVD